VKKGGSKDRKGKFLPTGFLREYTGTARTQAITADQLQQAETQSGGWRGRINPNLKKEVKTEEVRIPLGNAGREIAG